jgi:hypothetical protein
MEGVRSFVAAQNSSGFTGARPAPHGIMIRYVLAEYVWWLNYITSTVFN